MLHKIGHNWRSSSTAVAATNNWSQREGRSALEAAAGAVKDVSLEVRWLVERLGGGEVLISSQGQRGINLSYAHLFWGGAVYTSGGGGKG